MKKVMLLLLFTISALMSTELAEFVTNDHNLLYGRDAELDYYLDTREGMISDVIDQVRAYPSFSKRLWGVKQILHILSQMEFHINARILESGVLSPEKAYERHARFIAFIDSLSSLDDEQLERQMPPVGDIRALFHPGDLPRDVWARQILERPRKTGVPKPNFQPPAEPAGYADAFGGRKILARDNNIGAAPAGYQIPPEWEKMPEYLRPPLHIAVEQDTHIVPIRPGEPIPFEGLARGVPSSGGAETEESMASTFWSESFEGSSFPPSGWAVSGSHLNLLHNPQYQRGQRRLSGMQNLQGQVSPSASSPHQIPPQALSNMDG